MADIDLSEVDEASFAKEAFERGFAHDDIDHELAHKIYDLFAMGKDDEAVQLVKDRICELTGRIL